MLSAQQISDNWDKFIANLASCCEGDRYTKLFNFYNERKDEIAVIPASSNLNHHSAFVGGYVYHVNNVVEMTRDNYRLWKKYKGVSGFELSELIFAAIHHDMGKIGDLKTILYQPIREEWKLKKGMIYEYHPDVTYMSIPDRSLMLLNQLGIVLTENEYITIKVHDGIYDEANKAYYMSPSTPRLKNNMPYILHAADLMAARTEYFDHMQYLITAPVETNSGSSSLINKLKNI